MSDDSTAHGSYPPDRAGTPQERIVGDHVVADEIAVTDVPDEVRRELSALFGSHAAPSTGDVDVTSEVGGSTDHTPVSMDAGGADVVQIIDDQPELVVIDADEVDRVVIVDDDRPDPSFEERQRRRDRRNRLKRVKWLKIAALSAAGVMVILVLLASPLFAIRDVSVEGSVYTARDTVERAVAALKGKSVFTVDTDKARAICLSDPWVSDVRITTGLSGHALIEVVERVPVVWYAGADQKARVVDAKGHVIAVLSGWPTKYLQVRGTGPALEAGAVADPAYRAAAQLVLALPDEVRPKVEALELSPGGELSMVLKSRTLVRFGPPTDLQNKLVAVVVLLRRQDPSTLAVVDVSTGEPTVQTR